MENELKDPQKNTQKERIRQITDQLESGITELFESERYANYMRFMGKFHQYSMNNTLLIFLQRPDATLVASYNDWKKKFNRQVVKGAKAIKIIAPNMSKRKKQADVSDESGAASGKDSYAGTSASTSDNNPEKEPPVRTPSSYRVVNVFDISDTDGPEIPSICVNELTGDVANFDMFFEAICRACPVPITFEQITSGAKGYYHLKEERIAIQENMSQVQTVKTAIHETAHAMIERNQLWEVEVQSRENRSIEAESREARIIEAPTIEAHNMEAQDMRTQITDSQITKTLALGTGAIPNPIRTRGQKEVEAESVAYTVCSYWGIENVSDYSFAYISSWASDKSLKELKDSLGIIHRTADELITKITFHLDEIRKERGIPATASIQENPLRALEDYLEQNDNSFDGILNNMPEPTKTTAGQAFSDSTGNVKVNDGDKGNTDHEKSSVLERLHQKSAEVKESNPTHAADMTLTLGLPERRSAWN